jgi:adenylate cyclase
MSAASLAHARVVARLRERGHSLADIRAATESGKLASSYIEGLLPDAPATWTLDEAARETGLEPALIERILTSMGFGAQRPQHLTDDDVQLLRYAAAVLAAGLPLVAFLQLVRVYGQAMSQIADAEVRLFHLYVHEPLMRDGIPGWEMAEEMEGLAREIMPLAAPIMDHAHNRFLQHFIEQDVIGHMEADLDVGPPGDRLLGRLRVAIAFADLAGYTRLTEEVGDEEAVGAVERFVEQVELSLPDDARIIKTIGDEVMVVGTDPGALLDWAVRFQADVAERPLPRIGIHYGETLYRDGDYYGREVNQASRVAARAAGGEVLATRPVIDHARPGLTFERIGEVRLKGFADTTELFLARGGGKQG